MKRLLLLSLLVLAPISAKTFPVKEEGGRPIKLISYQANKKSTVLTLQASKKMKACFHGSGKNIPFILYNNKEKQYAKNVKGIKFCPKKRTISPGYTFSVTFPAPKKTKNVKKFSFIEGRCGLKKQKGCWRFKNISLAKKVTPKTVKKAATVPSTVKANTKSQIATLTNKDISYAEKNKLTPADLSNYSKVQLQLLRNYFFAKYGTSFRKGSISEVFFKKFSWYKPKKIKPTKLFHNKLNKLEKHNVILILAIESGQPVEKIKAALEKSRPVKKTEKPQNKKQKVPAKNNPQKVISKTVKPKPTTIESCTTGKICYALATLSEKTNDKLAAKAYFSKSCDLKYVDACNDLARLSKAMGKVAEIEPAYQKGCDLGNYLSCYQLAEIKSKTNKAVATTYLEKSCQLAKKAEKLVACPILGKVSLDNYEKHKDKLTTTLGKGCDVYDIKKACFMRGYLAYQLNNKKSAETYFSKACTLNSAAGCKGLGVIKEGNKDKEAADKYYAKSCDLGKKEVCTTLANRKDKAGDKATAKKLYAKGCDLKDGQACYKLGLYKKMDIDLVKSKIQKENTALKSYLKQACDLKYQPACQQLKKSN